MLCNETICLIPLLLVQPNGMAQRRADLARRAGSGTSNFGRIPLGGRSPARPLGPGAAFMDTGLKQSFSQSLS